MEEKEKRKQAELSREQVVQQQVSRVCSSVAVLCFVQACMRFVRASAGIGGGRERD